MCRSRSPRCSRCASRATRWVAWAIAGFAWTAIAAQQRLDERLATDPPQREVAIAGFVDGFPTFAPGQVTFSFAVAEPRPEGVPPLVRLTWYRPPRSIEAGERLELVARLRAPHGARNPGGFDYEQWLLVTRPWRDGLCALRSARAARGSRHSRALGSRCARASRSG